MSSLTTRSSGLAADRDAAARFFFSATDILIVVADEQSVIVAVNPACERGLARARDTLVGRTLADIVPATALAQLTAAGPRHVAAAAPRPVFEMDIEGRGRRWVEADLTRKDGRIVLALIDITDLGTRLAEVEEARRSRDLLLHDAQVGTWRFDPDAEIYYFSPELLSRYDDAGPFAPKALVDSYCHPDDLVVEKPIRERITREGGSGEMELRMRVPGQPGWAHRRILLRSGRRMPSGLYEMYGLTQEITELARARDEARANAERLRIALNAASAGVFEIDFAAREVWCSPEFVAMVGRPMTFDEIRNGSWAALHPDDLAVVQAMENRWSSSGSDSVDVRTGNQVSERWVRIYCNIERDADRRPLRGVGLILDIDERKRQELALVEAQKAAEEATAAKSAFLASVSHEIRTPMNGIVGVLHLLKAEHISPEGQKLLDEALACSGMLSQLINDVLDFSKIEAGKLDFAPEPTHAADALAGVVGLLEPQARARGLAMRVTADPAIGWVTVDPIRLRQCLFNLIGNAVKFTVEGSVEVRLTLSADAPERLRIEVEDTGVGIAEAAKARVFGRFEQADTSSTRSANGAGLGLAISRSLARMMGGDIDFVSEQGRGSTFWLEVTAPPAEAPDTRAPVSTADSLDGLRVLVVDDNATNRLIGVKILESLGAEAAACEDGPASIAAARDEAYDLILMDVNMPGMDGVEATALIRALPGPAGRVPILALTANVMAHQRQSYLAAGMDGVVPKPFAPAALMAEISRVLVAYEDDEAASA